jgi:hypothetical protein
MMQPKKNHWPSIAILAVLGLSAALLLMFFAVGGIMSLVDLFSGKGDPAAQMIGVFAFGVEFIFLLICAWFVFQKAMGREQADTTVRFPFASWHILAGIAIVFLSVVIGLATTYTEIKWLAWVVLPVLTVFVILPPIWLLFGFGSKAIELGSRWRLFGILGLSMTLAPVIMVVLEVIVLLVVVAVAALFIAVLWPGYLQEIISLGKMIDQAGSEDVIMSLLGPYLVKPVVIIVALGYISVLVPMIEELFKPLAVWLFARTIDTPAQGFVFGLLSGGAFSLIESLNASSDGTTGWAVIVSVRAGTSLLHMTVSGLMGWGIVSAFRERRILRFFAVYISAVALHGLWNACALGAGLSAMGESLGRPEWLFRFIPATVGGMAVIGVGMFFVLIASNRKLQSLPSSPILHSKEGMSEGEGVQ